MTSSTRPMQERAERTRKSILEAAAVVFERAGYSAARLEEIAEEAEVTKGALYFHFRSKSHLAAAVVGTHFGRWAEIVQEVEGRKLGAVDTLEAMCLAVAGSFQHSVIARAGVRLGNEYLLVDAELPRPFVGWVDYLTKLLRSGKRRGEVSADLDCAAAARSIVGSYFGIQEMSSRLHDGSDLLKRVREWWAFVEPSLRPVS